MSKSASMMNRIGNIVSFWPNTAGTFSVQSEHYLDFCLVEALTKKELMQLAQELIDLANSIN